MDQTGKVVRRWIGRQKTRKTDRRDFTERNIRMKKLKVFSVILLVTSIGAFVAFQGYTRMIQDPLKLKFIYRIIQMLRIGNILKVKMHL